MPVNNIQYRAEIGIFNSIIQPVQNVFKINWFNYFCVEASTFFNLICRIGIHNIIAYSVCFLLTLIMFPILSILTLSFSNSLDIVNLAVASFSWIYFSICLTAKIFNHIIDNSKIITRICLNIVQRYFFFFQVCFFLPYLRQYLLTCGDIESNPGPGKDPAQHLTICHWNLNGIASHNFIKVSLIEAFNCVQNFDIICISETFLDSTYLPDDPRLSLKGYVMIRSDHPSDTKRGGVCIYYKEHLPFINRTDLSFINECLLLVR